MTPLVLALIVATIAAVVWCALCLQAWEHLRKLKVAHTTVETAYAELIKGSVDREQALLAEKRGFETLWKETMQAGLAAKERAVRAELDADRLAPIVEAYVRIIDDTAALLKDESPPSIAAERAALSLHAEAVKFRTAHETNKSNQTEGA